MGLNMQNGKEYQQRTEGENELQQVESSVLDLKHTPEGSVFNPTMAFWQHS